ncbi:MAG: hypothetical protein FJY10_10290 [Bacteroidetes bacterium]|nr:hypothetical protein [Bacteroidota bacterium]
MLSGIIGYIGAYHLKNELGKVKRFRRMVNLRDAKTIGILYLLPDEPSYGVIEKIVGELQREQKEVWALGLVRNKNLVNRFLPKLSYDFITPGNLNWFGKPTGNKVKAFIQKEFDILIDLSLSDTFTMKYISGLSHAHLKVGPNGTDHTNYYDLLIEKKDTPNVESFFRHALHYLQLINQPSVT